MPCLRMKTGPLPLLMLLAACPGSASVRDGAAGDLAVSAGDGADPDTQPHDGSVADSGAAVDQGTPADQQAGALDSIPSGLAQCMALSPSASATVNRSAITSCLKSYGVAQLQAGTYPVSDGIAVPDGAKLLGLGGGWPTLRLSGSPGANYLVKTGTGSRVGFLRLDAANLLNGKQNAAVVSVAGDNAQVDNNHIGNAALPPKGSREAGVYIIGDKVKGNVIDNNKISSTFYGVIFRNGLTAQHINVVKNNTIFDVKCDSVTFAGYGQLINNTIYRNGWDCENGPIPGGGVYALSHTDGGLVEGNTIYDNCGHGIDMDRVSNFTIRSNIVHDPGYQWGGSRAWCSGASGMFLIDVSHFVVEKNSVSNNNRSTNRVGLAGDPNAVFSKVVGTSYSDLPHGGLQTIAFVLAKRRNTSELTVANTVKDNTFVSGCASSSQCVGLGYFASRGTGYGAGGSWSAATTNYYTKNSPFGSQVGSKRCGGNWYAASSTCGDPASGDCNIDDYQHNPPVGDWARNDGCGSY